MLEEVLILLLLTVLFTFCTVFALILRKRLHGGAGQFMYVIWLAVMIASVIPMQIAPPAFRVIVSERSVTEVNPPYRDRQPGIMVIADAAHELHLGELPVLRAYLYAAEDPVVSDNGDTVAFNLSSVMIAGARFLLFIWAMGMSYCMVRELLEYREIKRFLLENSDPCTDLRMLARFEASKKQLGIRRNIPLRRIREICPTTPCVIGFIRPVVFLSAFCDDLDSSHLENIFTHELCHVKRRDMFYKLFMVLTSSVHWFNPISILFRRAVTEDCEMACDATVLRNRRTTAVRDYMESILTVAERVRKERQARRGQHEPIFRAAFFMANDTTPNYLKRRYLHMKTTREKKNHGRFSTICACVLACIAASNVALLSSCSYIEAMDLDEKGITGPVYVGDPIEIALANHFCVPTFSDITEEQFDAIRTLDIYLVTPQDEAPDAVYVSVNGDTVEMLLPCIWKRDVFDNYILPKIDALDAESDEASFSGKKFRAFYSVKDPTDPDLDPSAIAEMQALFPITKTTPVALYDPYTTEREEAYLYARFCEAGLVNDAAFSVSALEAKLGSISVLDGVRITVTEADSIADFSVDSDLFSDRGLPYQEYMSEYMMTVQNQKTELQDLLQDEINMQIDINGNGTIGE